MLTLQTTLPELIKRLTAHTDRYPETRTAMKKPLIFYIIAQTATAMIFLFLALTLTKGLAFDQLHTVQNLAGAVLADFPEAESVFMDAVQHKTSGQLIAGEQLLARYGYDETDYAVKNPLYLRFPAVCTGIALLFFTVSVLFACLYLYTGKKQQNAREARLLSLLARCLDDDYSFLSRPEELSALSQGASRSALPETFRKLAQKLQLKTEALAEEKDHTKALVTDISHQLKTPLSALKTCFLVYMEADTPEEAEEFLHRCRTQIEKLENLTASLLHISRLENAMILIQPKPASLTDILIEAVEAVYEKAAAKQISIDTDDFQDISLTLDQKWTAEALSNILDNAVKYSPKETLIQIRVQKLYSFVRVEIEDQGIGVPKEEYNHIFGRFYRGKSETVQKTEGSGVGLYLSRKILEDQGGTLSVKPARLKGSIFVVQLPV